MRPAIRYCPYCGSNYVRLVDGYHLCNGCHSRFPDNLEAHLEALDLITELRRELDELRMVKGPVERKPAPIDESGAPRGVVYLVAAGDFRKNGTPVKIGYSIDPYKRLGDLQVSHHKPLTLVATIPGTRTHEDSLHRELRSYHIHGEWFRSCEKIRELVADPDKWRSL